MEAVAEELVSLDDLLHAFTAHERNAAILAIAAARHDSAGTWAADGSLSMAAYLRHRARMSHRDATRWIREGRFLTRFDAIGDAATTGRLSASQITAIRTNVTRPTADILHQHQHDLINTLDGLDAATTEQVCQQWRQQAEAVADMPEPAYREREWRTSTLEDGTTIGSFVLDPTGATELDTALQTARTFDGAGDERTAAQRNADAIVDILGFFNSNHAGNGTPRHRPHVELHLHTRYPGDRDSDGDRDPFGPDAHSTRDPLLDGCAITADGRLLPQWATDAHLCDCVIHRIMRAGSSVLDYGRATYTVPKPLWRAVAARDGGCRAPGCTRPIAWCDAHHIIWWRKHGHTKLDNLLMLCGRHHRLVHREKWHIRLLPNGDVEFVLPDNRLITTQPRGQPTIRAA